MHATLMWNDRMTKLPSMGSGAMSTSPLDNSNHGVQGTPMAPTLWSICGGQMAWRSRICLRHVGEVWEGEMSNHGVDGQFSAEVHDSM